MLPCEKMLEVICRVLMEIYNASAAPIKTNQLWNEGTVGWESRNIITQPVEFYNRKSKVITFVVNASMHIVANHFKI